MLFEQTQSEQRNFEQNTLVWFNENIQNENEINNIKARLRSIINYLRIFNDIDECIDYISSNDTERIYLIITSLSANVIIPCIDEIQQIKMIYIFIINKLHINPSKKTLSIHDNLSSLCDAIRNDISIKTSTYNSSDLELSSLSSSRKNRSDRQEASFMYFLLLTETLVGLKHKQSTRDEFISFCRQQYDGNTSEIEKIDEFQRTYSKKSAIHWYTRDSFLYRILNNALRIQDIEILYQLGFFIADLYCELESLCKTQLQSSKLPLIVYRGQFMTKREFDNKIRNNIGGFLSINSFFSTSVNKQVALMFTNTSSANESNIESILFEIVIDIEKYQQPIADIKNFSYMHEEDEILFSMGTVFRIKAVERSKVDNVWIIHLLMNGEEDEELKSVHDNFKPMSNPLNNPSTIANILFAIGEYEKAKQFMLMLIKDTRPDDFNTIASYYSILLTICNNQENYDEGLMWAEKALQLSPNELETLTGIYVNAGASHAAKNNFALATECFYKVINGCQNKSTLENQRMLGIAYSNLGLLYARKGDTEKALTHLFEALDIQKSLSPYNISQLSITYRSLGIVYYSNEDYKSTMIYLLKCTEIQDRVLSEKHPTLAISYIFLGMCYLESYNYEEAYEYFRKFSEIVDILSNKMQYVDGMYHVARTYIQHERYSEALYFFHKLLDIQMRSSAQTNSLLINIYHQISTIHLLQGNYSTAIDYCRKGIPIALKCNNEKLVSLYNTITSSFILLSDIKQATHYAKLALDSGNAMLPPDHHDINTANMNADLLSKYF